METASSTVGRRLLTLEQAAHYLGQNVRWVRRHMASTTERDSTKGTIKTGDLPVARMGKSPRFRVEDLDKYIEEHMVFPDGHPEAKAKTKKKRAA
jgi:hypothetical protein